jgi:hypothetical protein
MDDLTPKLSKDTLFSGTSQILGVDTKNMSVTSVLSTANEDRDGDIIEPSGIDTTEHRRNPVVFFNHFRPRSEPTVFALPVGKAENHNGEYTVKLLRDPDRLVATTYFSQKTPVAGAIFSLYAEGILRAWSIGVKPLEQRPRTNTQRAVGMSLPAHVLRSELVEYSAVGVGSNRDALTVKLQKGFGLTGTGSKPIELMLKAALEPYTIPPTAWAFGWTPLEKTMSDPIDDTTVVEPLENEDQVAELVTKTAEPVVEKAVEPGINANNMESLTSQATRIQSAVTEVMNKSDQGTSDMPAGAQYLASMMDHINEAMGKVENPEVVSTYKKCGKLVNKCWSKCYSGHGEKACKGCDDADDMTKQLSDLMDKVSKLEQENGGLKQAAFSDAKALTKFASEISGLRTTIFRLTGKAA